MKKNIIFLLIIFQILMSNYAFANTSLTIPNDFIIRVGIEYNNNTSNFSLNSSSGFALFLHANHVEISLFELTKEKKLTYKNSAYHIRLTDKSVSSADVLKQIGEFKKIDDKVFISFDDGWFLAYGNYADKEIGQNNINITKNKFSLNQVFLYKNNNSIDLVDSSNNTVFNYDSSQGEFYVKPLDSNFLDTDKYSYRGGIGAKNVVNSGISIINYIYIEDYLYGVVPNEMSSSWPLESLKAQAVAARNYSYSHLNKHIEYGFDICDSTDCQVYSGTKKEAEGSSFAVDLTKGELLLYNNTLVEAYFHSNSGGHTESSENIWSSVVPYLRGVKDNYSLNEPNSIWSKTFTPEEIEKKLADRSIYIGKLEDVTINHKSENGRVLSISFKGSNTNVELKKEKIRSIFGYNIIKSIWYSVIKDNEVSIINSMNYGKISLKKVTLLSANGKTNSNNKYYQVFNGNIKKKIYSSSNSYTFEGKGYGHGLGMSQWGAKKMAEEGYTYEQILSHYYTDTVLNK
ncbi:SpoIID/LytB domain-containing protein [Helicovermis profundi]|uniref:Sporulation stage II protein D amidase enhancer LytB N-terminal domain-containing protein n=1 Tax=Helicovermis profundi TaxID=3065157 RepID=A0AAU9E519_9FIRM|nr:hypothetical protein HLPR_14610 [Clostridia bacterium S502]